MEEFFHEATSLFIKYYKQKKVHTQIRDPNSSEKLMFPRKWTLTELSNHSSLCYTAPYDNDTIKFVTSYKPRDEKEKSKKVISFGFDYPFRLVFSSYVPHCFSRMFFFKSMKSFRGIS